MKKNFSTTENPALQFITTPGNAAADASTEPLKENQEAKEAAGAANQKQEAAAKSKDSSEKKPAKKKSPAKNKGGRPKKEGETRSRRYNLLLQDSTAEALQKIAYMERTSVNELINRITASYIDDHKESIEKYNSIFNGQ